MNNKEESINIQKNNIIELNEKIEDENMNKINEQNSFQNSTTNPNNLNNQKTNKKENNNNKNTNLKYLNDEDSSENYSIEDKKLKLSFINKRKHQISKKSPNKNKKLKTEDNEINDLTQIINISEFLSNMNKDNTSNISNSDMILIILEICLNSSQFNIYEDNSSRTFWEEIGKKEILFPITNIFRPETLRKYWRNIRNINKPKKIINAVKEYKDKINNENIKLLSSINIICDYVLFRKKGIDYFINKYCPKSSNNNTKIINIKDMTINEQIDELIKGFEEAFPLKSKNEIMEKLYQNSFNVKNTYLVLKDEVNFGYLSFNKEDDELVLNKNIDNEQYKQFALSKGHINILKRRKFLEGNIENDE